MGEGAGVIVGLAIMGCVGRGVGLAVGLGEGVVVGFMVGAGLGVFCGLVWLFRESIPEVARASTLTIAIVAKTR